MSIMSRIVIETAPAGTLNFHEILWQNITITKSLDEICHSVELILPISQRSFIHKHDKIIIQYENQYITTADKKQLVTTVLVDEIQDTTNTREKTVSILCRSSARDIIDSTWTEDFKDADLFTIIQNLSKKFDLPTAHHLGGANQTQIIKSFSIDNESPWTHLLGEADNQGYVFTSNQNGGLYLTRQARAAGRDWGFFLTEGKNIKTAKIIESGAEQFHEYIVKGGGKEISVIDHSCKNKRVFTVNITDFSIDEEKMRRRAKTEMQRRKENKVKLSVSGWGLTTEQLKDLGGTIQKEIFWEPNFLIPVSLPSYGINDTLLTKTIKCIANTQTMETTIELTHKGAYYG